MFATSVSGRHYSDVGSVSKVIKDEEGVCPCLDALDHLLCRPVPGIAAQVSDMFVLTFSVWLVDAGHSNVCHLHPFPPVFRYCEFNTTIANMGF